MCRWGESRLYNGHKRLCCSRICVNGKMESGKADWQNLPKDLLVMLVKCSEASLLRAVCSWWRSSLVHTTNKSPLFSVKIPSLPMVPNKAHDPTNGLHFTLTERNIYCLQPLSDENNCNDSKSRIGWMLKLQETSSGKVKPFHTLSNSSHWPKSRNKLPSVLNLFDYNTFGVAKEYKLTCIDDRNDISHKVVMASVDHAIMCIFGRRKLAHFKYGDENWTMIDDGLSETCDYSDVIHHKERFYVIDNAGNVIVIDSSFNVKVIAYPAHLDRLERSAVPVLVESCGDLFVVIKQYGWYSYSHFSDDLDDDYLGNGETLVSFLVFKFNSDKSGLVQVTNLQDQSFFIGDGCCFSVSTKQFSGCVGNVIYFIDSEFVQEDRDYPGSDVGIFQLGKNCAEPLKPYGDNYSPIFWPIPEWLKPEEVSKPSSSNRGSSSRRRSSRKLSLKYLSMT